ncbi:caspase family protein [Streptomyces sp. NPDC004539]|uniref:caspase, EACC1-associated type n=1 Tax=Streptomyces sp. NPDC004539 TaxID=3154280 RepID=UPI0033A4DB3B
MGRRLALLVATYDHQDATLRQLTSPAQDAEALAAVLRDPDIAGFEVTTLVNEPYHRVGSAISDLYRDRRRDDLTLLYFTGHGLKDDHGRLYLATTDTRHDSLLFTALSAEQIAQAMEGCASRRMVLILDCCYSGAFPAHTKGDTEVHALERFQGRGRTVLTASDSTQYSFDGERAQGQAAQSVFTRYLVEGLRDGSADLDGDGDITLDELYGYVHDRVVEAMPQQRPKKQDDVEGRIVIAHNINWRLPVHLRNALASPMVGDRLGALDGLTRLHRIGNATVRVAVLEEIRRLEEDDSKQVSAAAAVRLASLTPRPVPPDPPAPPPPPPEPEPEPPAHPEPELPAHPEPPSRPEPEAPRPPEPEAPLVPAAEASPTPEASLAPSTPEAPPAPAPATSPPRTTAPAEPRHPAASTPAPHKAPARIPPQPSDPPTFHPRSRATTPHKPPKSRKHAFSTRAKILAAVIVVAIGVSVPLWLPLLQGKSEDNSKASASSAGGSSSAGPFLRTAVADAGTSAVFSPDGKLIATTGSTGVRLLRATDAGTVTTLPQQAYPLFSRAGNLLATMDTRGTGKTTVHLRDVAGDGTTGSTIDIHTGAPASVTMAFSPRGDLLATAAGLAAGQDYDNPVRLWNTATGKLVTTLPGFGNGVQSMVFTPDGKTLAAGAAGSPGTVKLWNVTTGKVTATLPTGYVIALSPDGKTLATSSEFAADHKASLWDVTTGKRLAALAEGRPLGFSGDGALLALMDAKDVVQMWRVSGGTYVSSATAMATAEFGPTGERYALLSAAGAVTVVDYANSGSMHTLTPPAGSVGKTQTVDFSADGSALVTADQDGTVRVWMLNWSSWASPSPSPSRS